MFGLTLDAARNAAVAVGGGLAVLAVASAWIMKSIVQKVIVFTLFSLLAVLVWTQRSSLDECADRVRAAGLEANATCSILGREIKISTQHDS